MSKTRSQTRDYFNALLRDAQRANVVHAKQIALLDCFAYDERELDALRDDAQRAREYAMHSAR